jgi:pimeloyl-ACP methyl ester carboxylesterase
MPVSTLEAAPNARPGIDPEPRIRPHLVVVLVSPPGGRASCEPVIGRLIASGAFVFTEEIAEHAQDSQALGDAVWRIAASVARAAGRFRGVPVVLVGHGSGAAAAVAYSDLYADELDGLVLTGVE